VWFLYFYCFFVGTCFDWAKTAITGCLVCFIWYSCLSALYYVLSFSLFVLGTWFLLLYVASRHCLEKCMMLKKYPSESGNFVFNGLLILIRETVLGIMFSLSCFHLFSTLLIKRFLFYNFSVIDSSVSFTLTLIWILHPLWLMAEIERREGWSTWHGGRKFTIYSVCLRVICTSISCRSPWKIPNSWSWTSYRWSSGFLF